MEKLNLKLSSDFEKKKKLGAWSTCTFFCIKMRGIETLKLREKNRFQNPEGYIEPWQRCEMGCFPKIVNSFWPLTIWRSQKIDLRSLIGFLICHWHHYISNYYVSIFTVNIFLQTLHFFCFVYCQYFTLWWIVFVVWLTNERRLGLFPAATSVRDRHHCESPTRREQVLNLRRTWVQALLNEVVQ